MSFRALRHLAIVPVIALVMFRPATACCPTPPQGKPIVNADQSVIVIWDAENKTQHFIRKASFKGEADDFGFLIPSPTKPELAEAGNEAFPMLEKLTEPPARRPVGGMPFGCGVTRGTSLGETRQAVRVLDEKLVAGFNAAVLEADSAGALVEWLSKNGYNYSPQIEAWAKPYVDGGWKITALKVAKADNDKAKPVVTASALRMSFRTDRPLFPYREPDYGNTAVQVQAKERLLRIYFIAEARYEGQLTRDNPWTGKVAWAGRVSDADRKRVLASLQLPPDAGPDRWYMTEFEDRWPYKVAPADVYFSRSREQKDVRRVASAGSARSIDLMPIAIVGLLLSLPVITRARRRFFMQSAIRHHGIVFLS
jgi:hypothetical protein